MPLQEPQEACWWKCSLCSSHTSNKWQVLTHPHLWCRQTYICISLRSQHCFLWRKKNNPEHTGPSLQLLPPAYHPSPSQRKICPVVKKHKQGHYHVNSSSVRTDQSLYFLKHWGLLKAFPNLTAQSPTSWNVIQGKESARWSFLPAHAGARPEGTLHSTPGACGALKQVLQLRRAHAN